MWVERGVWADRFGHGKMVKPAEPADKDNGKYTRLPLDDATQLSSSASRRVRSVRSEASCCLAADSALSLSRSCLAVTVA